MSLKPATNIRRIIPHVCATCTYGEMRDSGFTCKRTDAHGWACFSCDVLTHTCDLSPAGLCETCAVAAWDALRTRGRTDNG